MVSREKIQQEQSKRLFWVIQTLFSLIQAEDEQAVDTTALDTWSIPPGDSMFGFGGLYALDPGPHFVEMLLGGSAHESELISVRD